MICTMTMPEMNCLPIISGLWKNPKPGHWLQISAYSQLFSGELTISRIMTTHKSVDQIESKPLLNFNLSSHV